MRLTHVISLFALIALSACGDDDAADAGSQFGDGGTRCQIGSESCKCTQGGACDPGLTCASNVCVDLGSLGGTGGTSAGGTGGASAGGTGGMGGTGGTTAPATGNAMETLNASVILPNEGQPLVNPEIDTTVVIDSLPLGQAQPVMAGSMVSVSIPFSAASANVVAAGIRFGASGPIRTVMLPDAQGQSGATLAFDMQIPASVCADLANICHDIQCYEFAVTDAGRISRENIMDIALLCGNCSEPTCQALLPAGACTIECMTEAECNPNEACSMGLCVGEGALRFTLTWSASTDLDLHVITPNRIELSYSNSSGDSGELDRDNTSGGTGSVENIFFTAPPTGSYTYFVENFNGAQAASFMLQVFKDGTLVATQSETLPMTSDALSTMFMVSVP